MQEDLSLVLECLVSSPLLNGLDDNHENVDEQGEQQASNKDVTHIELSHEVLAEICETCHGVEESHQDPFVECLDPLSSLVDMWCNSGIVDDHSSLKEHNNLNLLEGISSQEDWDSNVEDSSDHEHYAVVFGESIPVEGNIWVEVLPLGPNIFHVEVCRVAGEVEEGNYWKYNQGNTNPESCVLVINIEVVRFLEEHLKLESYGHAGSKINHVDELDGVVPDEVALDDDHWWSHLISQLVVDWEQCHADDNNE